MKSFNFLHKIKSQLKVLVVVLFIILPIFGFYLLIKQQKITTSESTQVKKDNLIGSTRSNFAEINYEETIIASPDNKEIATFYYEGPERYKGDPTFSDVDLWNKEKKEKTSYHLTGDLAYAQEVLYWSPVDNRIYYTHSTAGIGIYSLWSSNVNGTGAQFIAGNKNGFKKNETDTRLLFNSAVYGASCLDFSPDGRTVVTARQDYASNYQSPLWLMSYDGTNSRPIPIDLNYENINSIKWQDDGYHILFTVWDGFTSTSYLTDINGTEPKQLIENDVE